MKDEPEKKARIQGKGKGFATVQLSTKEFLGKRNADRKKSFRKGTPANMLRLSKDVTVQKEMLVITGIISQMCRHWEPDRIGFQNGFNLSKKASLVKPPRLTLSWWNNL